MKFVKSEGTAALEAALIAELSTALAENKPILWLVPGGSNIAVVVSVMNALPVNDLSNLTLMLTDERYGEPGHKDSNYFQIHEAGIRLHDARFDDLLLGADVKETVRAYVEKARDAFMTAHKVIAFFGMGPDSHIAGILPQSPAVRAGKVWVESYEAPPFTRMTLTPFALSRVDVAFVGAYGDAKHEALDKLCESAATAAEQPSRILCHLPEVTIYNDYRGDEA